MMHMMNDEGLLECPGCGCMDAMVMGHDDSTIEYRVECQICGTKTSGYLYRDNAVALWNTRAGHLWTQQDFKDMSEEQKNDWP